VEGKLQICMCVPHKKFLELTTVGVYVQFATQFILIDTITTEMQTIKQSRIQTSWLHYVRVP